MNTFSPRVGLTVLFAFAFLGPSAGQENGLPNGTCFEDAIEEELRKNLTNMEGESVPVTFLLAGWSSAQVTSSVIEILISEILGYVIAIEPRVPASSLDSVYSMLGCATWWNSTSRGCETRKTKHHMMIDSWYRSFSHVINSLAEIYMEEMPINAGDMGYPGETGGYLPAAAVNEARNASGLALEYYANWDASWFTPSQYFTNVATVNTSDLMKCSDSLLTDNSSAYHYFAKSGDAGGVDITTDGEGVKTYKYVCQDGYFWLSSACRSDLTKCVPFITGGGGWDVLTTTQQAAAYNMPLALGVAATWSKFLEVPKKYKTMFYWWTPDSAFLEMQPSKLVLPPFNAYAWSQSDYTSAASAIPVAKIATKDLQAMAPDIMKLLEASLFDLEAVDSMMLNMKSNSVTRKQAACDWLKGNTDRWKSWIPKATKCNPGFGVYDDVTDTFTAERATATTCRACLPGMFSKAFMDDDGSTYICEACPAGQQQLGAGAMDCDACPAGTAKADQSTEECAPCAAGEYQDEKGALQCKMCPPGTTTMILGMKSISGCGCQAGSIDVSDLNSPDRLAANCIDCSEGLTCPMMSTVPALLAGSSPNGAAFTPVVKSGYFSLESEPIGMFKCQSTVQCPGGEPNTCGGGRKGVPCGECPPNTYWGSSKCTGCSAWSVIGWILSLILVFVGLVLVYYFMNAPMTAKASTLVSTTCAIGMMINMLQSLGIVGTMTVEWPVNINGIFNWLQVFTFDIDGFAFSCLAGDNPVARYIGLVLFFPACLLWLQFCGLISKVNPKWAWDTIKLRSTMGQFLQVAFSTMSSTALVPMICYKHPNGQRSNLKYPNVFCGSDEHTAMVIAGSLMLVLGVCGFWAFAAWLAYMCPKFSARGRYDLVQSAWSMD